MIKNLVLTVTVLLTVSFALNAGVKSHPSAYQMPAGINKADYMPGTLILRVLPEFRSLCEVNNIRSASFNKMRTQLGQTRLEKMFPRHQPPVIEKNEYGQPLVDLSLIYELHFTSGSDLVKTINALLSTGLFMYAEPKFIPTTQYAPNDPQNSAQYQLTKINAYNAWDIHKGDTNTVIGITDTGTDLDHPDLEPNLKYNYADPVNGIDDDADGYTDNFIGWDLGENDNNPQVGASTHGSHVSGCAAAVTDNGIGVASPGFYSRFLPVKIADATGALTKAYEGIVYAADMGCQIINCSWGGAGGSSFGQNIIDYATFNKNSLVVAAAGNNSSSILFYPAAYENVLCIAATGTNDGKSPFSNFGTYIDVCAPGSAILAAEFDNTYGYESGTSMASPIAAGCAAIVKSFYPTYNALQVGEQLRITADNIYSVGSNANYQGMLGTGRINLLNALAITGPSIRMKNFVVTDNNDDILVVNDTMRITGDITNFLDPTSNLVVTLTSNSPYVTIIDGSTTVGVLGTMATTTNGGDPFVVKINANAPLNESIQFKLLFQDGLYNDFQYFRQTVNVDYINITINDVFTTNTGKGRICYNGTGQTEGLGFNYNNDGSLSYETGFMVGINNNVADNVRNATGGQADEDFQAIVPIQKYDPGVWSDFDTYGRFSDVTNPTPLNLNVNYRSMSWTPSPFSKFHIFEYTIHNAGGAALNNVYAGIFSDWDIQAFANNKSDEDAPLKMGYVYCTDPGGYYAGIKLLTAGSFTHYAADNVTGGSGGIDMSDGVSDGEKFQALSTNRPTAGGAGTGNDVIDVVGTGPFNLASGDSVVVAFALIAGDGLSDLQSGAQQAQIKYNFVTSLESPDPSGIFVSNPYPNPTTGIVTVPFFLLSGSEIQMIVYDHVGREISSRNLGNLLTGEHQIQMDLSHLSSGVYHYRMVNNRGAVSGMIHKF